MAGRWTTFFRSAIVIWIGFIVPAAFLDYGARNFGGLASAVDCTT